MVKFLFVLVAALLLVLMVFILLYSHQKNKAEDFKTLYAEALRRNASLSQELGRLQAASIIRSEERGKADEKISNAYNGSSRERFDAINNGLQNNGRN